MLVKSLTNLATKLILIDFFLDQICVNLQQCIII